MEVTKAGYSKSADYYNLILVEFSIWGILTWANPEMNSSKEAEKLRNDDFWRYIQHVCSVLRLQRRHLGIYRQSEFSPGKKWHCHFIIAKRGTEAVASAALAATLRDDWRNGRADIREIDITKAREGIDYQSKPQGDCRIYTPALERMIKDAREETL